MLLSAFQRNLVYYLAGFPFAVVGFVGPTIEIRFRQDNRQENLQIDKEPANCHQVHFRTYKPAGNTDKKPTLYYGF